MCMEMMKMMFGIQKLCIYDRRRVVYNILAYIISVVVVVVFVVLYSG